MPVIFSPTFILYRTYIVTRVQYLAAFYKLFSKQFVKKQLYNPLLLLHTNVSPKLSRLPHNTLFVNGKLAVTATVAQHRTATSRRRCRQCSEGRTPEAQRRIQRVFSCLTRLYPKICAGQSPDVAPTLFRFHSPRLSPPPSQAIR